MKLVGITTWKFPESSVRLPSEPQPGAVYVVTRSQTLPFAHFSASSNGRKNANPLQGIFAVTEKGRKIVSLHASQGDTALAPRIFSSGHLFLTWL